MDDQQQAIQTLLASKSFTEAAKQILTLPYDKPTNYFLPLFDSSNGLERMQLFRELLSSHPLQQDEESGSSEGKQGGYMVKYFLCLRPSEHGVILEDMEIEKIQILLGSLNEEKRVEMVELVPYHVVEKLLPILSVITPFITLKYHSNYILKINQKFI